MTRIRELLELAKTDSYSRYLKIVTASVIGILVNVALGVIKIIVGTIANSVAVISDAVNNFSDSISSIVTIVTLAIVGKGATRKHPFGFGRMEYFSSLIISVIIMVTGAQFMIESVKKILHPESTSYTVLTLVLLAVAIVAKILLGLYTKGAGRKTNSPNLIASGQDALSDAIMTGVTLAAAIVNLIFPDLHIDGWVGVLVSIFVIKGGLEILLDVISKLMGERPSLELADKIMDEITSTPGILGAYDLAIHNYGPDTFIANVNLELDESMTMEEGYRLVKPLQIKFLKEYGIFVYFGFYSVNTSDPEIAEMRQTMTDYAMSFKDVLQIHAFYVDKERKFMSFDVVYSFDADDEEAIASKIRKYAEEKYPGYECLTTPDRDFTLSRDE